MELTNIIESMASARAPNRANAASTGLDAHPFVQQRGDVLIEQGILVSTCALVTLAFKYTHPIRFFFHENLSSFSFH
jgi:hypothetical protein